MITEEMLERGLAAAAEDYDVPAGAIDRVREHIAPKVEQRHGFAIHRPSRRGWLAMAGAAAVSLIALPFALGGSSPQGDRGGASPVAGAAHAPASNAGSGQKNALAPLGRTGTTAGGAARDSAGSPGGTGTGTGSASGAPVTTGSAPGLNYSYGNSQVPDKVVNPVPGIQDRVIKTGELDLQVAKGQVGHTLDLLTGLAIRERGYVADSRTSEGGFAPSGEVTLRVPVSAFDDAVTQARHITGVKVLGLQTSGEDVTSKYVDLKARIRALTSTRATFLTLLAKATTIGETLVVQQHVTDVQTQIEQLQGQLKVLANRSSMSTLTVTVDQKIVQPLAKTTHHKSGIAKALDRSVSRFVRGFEVLVGLVGPVLFIALLVGAGWLAARIGYRLLRRRLV